VVQPEARPASGPSGRPSASAARTPQTPRDRDHRHGVSGGSGASANRSRIQTPVTGAGRSPAPSHWHGGRATGTPTSGSGSAGLRLGGGGRSDGASAPSGGHHRDDGVDLTASGDERDASDPGDGLDVPAAPPTLPSQTRTVYAMADVVLPSQALRSAMGVRVLSRGCCIRCNLSWSIKWSYHRQHPSKEPADVCAGCVTKLKANSGAGSPAGRRRGATVRSLASRGLVVLLEAGDQLDPNGQFMRARTSDLAELQRMLDEEDGSPVDLVWAESMSELQSELEEDGSNAGGARKRRRGGSFSGASGGGCDD
jgi:hypothetical protein